MVRILLIELCSQFLEFPLSTLLTDLATQIISLFGIPFFKILNYIAVCKGERPHFALYWLLCGRHFHQCRWFLYCFALCFLLPVLRDVLSHRRGSYLERHLNLYFMVFNISDLDHALLQDLDVIRKHGKGSLRRYPWSKSFKVMILLTSFSSRKNRAWESYYLLSLVFLFAGARRLLLLGMSSFLSWRILPFLSLWAAPSSPSFCLTHTQSSCIFSPNIWKKSKWPIPEYTNKPTRGAPWHGPQLHRSHFWQMAVSS